jgi:competence ComEA-like helix-hairpin-helix protein
MYCITPQLYASLESYIQIPQENKSEISNSKSTTLYKFKDDKVIVELNSADTTELQKIKGIGSSFAKRIVKFRDMIGGFVRKEQLLEVFGFDEEKLDVISSQIIIDISFVKKININSASVEDLRKHPYMNKKAAVAIYMHRVNNGDFKSVQEIKELNFVNDSLYTKIVSYLKVE